MEPETEPLPISALQHWLFCPRQCALIHVERIWAENRFTAEGRLLHHRADDGQTDRRNGIVTLRALPIASTRLGIAGKADVVELRGPDRRPFPIEYKRGRPKSHRADEVQLCAQAICLEEMFEVAVPKGALFYGERRRRTEVDFDPPLRELTARVARDAGAAIAAGVVPSPEFQRARCSRCSLIDWCHPERLQSPPDVAGWLSRRIALDGPDP